MRILSSSTLFFNLILLLVDMSTNAPTALADGNNDVHEQHPVQRAADDDDFITNNISESAKSNSSKKKKRIHKKPMTPQKSLR